MTMLEQMRAQMDAQKMEFERQKVEMEEQYNRWKTELDAATKVTVARIGANPGVDIPLVEAATASAERMTAELGNGVQMALQNVERLQQEIAALSLADFELDVLGFDLDELNSILDGDFGTEEQEEEEADESFDRGHARKRGTRGHLFRLAE